ncbi:rhodanese-like domain-containing protein [Rhodopseudomonas palustris]|uniref:Rhodanese-like n=1 Tax=Rhodopseudomonas palustris (strain BisB18) TaxID=316056 RepID=Q217E2_RHOPB
MKLKTIDAKEADRLVAGGAALLDVRERHEIDREQIEGAVAVPLSRFAEADLEPFRGRKVIFFCHSGGRTRLYAAKLAARLQGIGEGYVLSGGIVAWRKAGLKTSLGPRPPGLLARLFGSK